MRKIIKVDATLMNTEMTTVKDMNLDIVIETMKADTRTIVASLLGEVEVVTNQAKLVFYMTLLYDEQYTT